MQYAKTKVADSSELESLAMSEVVNLTDPGAANEVILAVEDVDGYIVYTLFATGQELLHILQISAAEQMGAVTPPPPVTYDCGVAALFAKWAKKTRQVSDYYVLGRLDVYELLITSQGIQQYINSDLKAAGYDPVGIGHAVPVVQYGFGKFVAPSAESLNCGGKVTPYIPNPNVVKPGEVEQVGASEGMSAGWIFAGVAATAAAGAGLYYLTKRGRK